MTKWNVSIRSTFFFPPAFILDDLPVLWVIERGDVLSSSLVATQGYEKYTEAQISWIYYPNQKSCILL